MAAKKGKVTINGRFPAGTKVELHDRGAADVFSGGPTGDAVATATTNKRGETTLEAPPGSYFAVATVKDWNHITQQHEDRVRAVDVSIPAPPPEPGAPPAPEPPVGPEAPSPSFNAGGNIVMGARSSIDGDVTYENTQLVDPATGMVSTFASPVGVPTPAGDLPKVGVPQPRQEDHRETPLASSTLTGQAVVPKEQPAQQGDTKKKLEQASDTEQGFEVPAREVVRQEDFSGPQASDTPTGEAYPVGQAETPEHAQDQPPMVAGKSGSSQPERGTREPEPAPAPKDVEKVQKAANRSSSSKAAAKAADAAEPPQRSVADTTATTQPATDVRGVEHVEAPEEIRSAEESAERPVRRPTSARKTAAKKSSGRARSRARKRS